MAHHRCPIPYMLINLKSFAAPRGKDKCQVQRQGGGEAIKTIRNPPFPNPLVMAS